MNLHSLGTGKDCSCVIFLALLPHVANTVFFASPAVVKLQRGNLQWLVQGHGGLPKVYINSKTTPTPTPPKTSNVRCPAWLRITWQACLQGQCPLPQPGGQRGAEAELEQRWTQVPHHELRALSASVRP